MLLFLLKINMAVIHLTIFWVIFGITDGGTVFMLPHAIVKNSRHAAMEKIALILTKAGHDVTYFVPDEYDIPAEFTVANIDIVMYKYPSDKIPYRVAEDLVQDFMTITIEGEFNMLFGKDQVVFQYVQNLVDPYFNASQWKKLKEANFDLVIIDSWDCILGSIAKEYLDRPTILWSNAGYEMHFENWLMPMPLSHIPILAVPFSDQMSFIERAMNVYYYVLMVWYKRNWYDLRDECWSKVANRLDLPPTTNTKLSDGDLMFVQSNFAYFYPRPIMPNVIPVLGLKDKAHNPIDSKFAEFIDGAIDGFIVFTFGSMPRGMDEHRREIFASVFAKLKQRVLWRYSGPNPKSLGENTMLVPWLPQNDLLGHPKLKLFITHCGASGSAESVFNGVPIIGIPLFYDQRYHCTILTERLKMGLVVKFSDISTELVTSTIAEVLKNPKYKKNALKAQVLARDQPINASFTIQYWAEYVMKHKGAKHLQSKPMLELNFFQYYLMDVVLVGVTGLLLAGISFLFLMRQLYQLLFNQGRKLKIN